MAAPSVVERVTIGGREYRSVREGAASILAPFRENGAGTAAVKKPRNNDEGDQAVFYNPIQQFNRDLSVLAILIYGEGALIQKQARFQKKSHSLRNRKGKAPKPKSTASNGEQGKSAVQTVADTPTNKRKLDELDPSAKAEESNTAAKKQRLDDFDLDGDELEVLELEGVEQHDTEAAASNPSLDVTTNGVTKEHTDAASRSDPAGSKRTTASFTILDALSATGLRALRYAKEIPFATNVIANDLSPEAVKSINLNIDHNKVGEIVHSNVGDARSYMYSKVGNEHQPAGGKYVHRFDVIDLDPYGTAAPFLDAAVQALQDGGMLCVTCTDAGVFASNGYPEKAYALYGGTPMKGTFSHEAGLRLILHAVASSAAKYGIAVEPLLSLSIDFYARLFIRVHKQPKDVKLLAGTTMIVYNCDQGCGAWNTQLIAKNQAKEAKNGDVFYKHGFAQAPSISPSCEHCGYRMHLGGPMWAGLLHNPYFVQRILDRLPTLDKTTYQTLDRLQGMLTVVLEEDLTLASSTIEPESNNTSEKKVPSKTLASDLCVIPRLPPDAIDQSPFFFIPNYVAKVIHCQTMSEDQLRGAIRHLGYRVTRSHCKAGSFRTTAPWSVIWEIFREWVRTQKPIKADAVKPGTAGWGIMRNFRGSERKAVKERRDAVVAKLDRCENLEDMRTVLEAEMFKLEHPSTAQASKKNGEEGVVGEGGRGGGEGGAVVSVGGDETDPAGAAATTTTMGTPPAAPLESSRLKVIFDENLGKEKPRGKLVRYQLNPRANWGPMNRAA